MKSDPPASDRDDQLARLLAQMTDDVQSGLPVDIDHICHEHPDLSDELQELWGAVMVAEAIGSGSLVAADETMYRYDSVSLSIELPCRFGDYELLAEVGRGGMGVVYRARQISLNRQVAVKMILRGQLASDVDRERFRAEAEAVASLNHPGIVPVYEVGDIDGQPFFSMKLLQGQTLSQLMAAGPMSPREAARILAIVASAVHFAHRQGVLHRDLKPSNIFIDEQAEPHVMDFGLAKRTMATDDSLTHTGAIIGTPSYMAPEQATAGREPVGPGSDVFSLGTILYQALTGRPPFQAASPVDTLLMLRDQDVVPPRVVNPRADRLLEIIALRCLQKPVKLRYDTARGLAEDLEAYLNDEPIAAHTGRFADVVASLFRETHHAVVLEDWGLLWMWHSLVLFIACALTNAMHWYDLQQRWVYIVVWTVGLWVWAAVFWWLRRRIGPVTFVERQIAHVWAASMIAIALLFYIEIALEMPVLGLSPVLALVAGIVFMVKAGILSGTFYFQAAAMFLTAFAMARFPDFAHLIFGAIAAICFFVPGLKYHRQRQRAAP
jgi:serine/threonine-protein kinase